MNLHICTISQRNDFLETIHRTSIPYGPDIKWHIARSVYNPVTYNFNGDSRVHIHELTCDDSDTPFKMNYIFDNIINTDSNSYFCILDDDTLFHSGMYEVYKQYRNIDKKFMVIGRQEDKNGITRLYGTLPVECAIDSGNVLCHSHVLVPERWSSQHWDDKLHADYEFWFRCYKHFRLQLTDITDKTISIYNKFSDKEDTLDYIRA